MYLQLRKQHICVHQPKSICRENTVLKFLALVSRSQGYRSASDCSAVTPLSASTKENTNSMSPACSPHQPALRPTPSGLSGSCSEVLEAMLLLLTPPCVSPEPVWTQHVDLSTRLPTRAGATSDLGVGGPVSKAAAAKPPQTSATTQSGRRGLGSLPGLSQTVPAKELGMEKLPEGQNHKPGDSLGSGQPLADTLNRGFQTCLTLQTSAVSVVPKTYFLPSRDATSVIGRP